jgi:hypothetical protein
MSSHNQHRKDDSIMMSVAESIGSAMGSIAAHASEVTEALSPIHLSHAAQIEGKKFVRKSKTLVRKIQKKASTSLKHNKLATATRRALRGNTSKAKRPRPVASKRKVAPRGMRKK